MTPTDQEVEAVARAIQQYAKDEGGSLLIGYGWGDFDSVDEAALARAAIIRLDEVRGK